MSILIHLQQKQRKDNIFLKMPLFKLKRKQQTAAHLLYMPQTAVRSAHGSRTGKLHAALGKLGIKRIVLGNVDRHTFTVTKVILSQKLAVIRATRNCRSVR
jgi:hypothetical protein